MSDFHGLPLAVLENKSIRLEYLTTAGPRIVSLSYNGSPNMLADVHDITWDTPNGVYSLLGGHRLWISPEIPEKTSIPDKSGLRVRGIPGGVELTGEHEPGSGVRKSIRIELTEDRPSVRLHHTIVNENPVPVTIAAWAITMFRQGGTVILPQPVGNVDPAGLLNNRLIALWPYARIADPRLTWRDDFVLLSAAPSLPPVKIGYHNPAGWLAYWQEGILFRKSFDVHPEAVYPDGGCTAETYCNDRFVELETLGPLTTLPPWAETHLTETWDIFPGLEVDFIPEEIRGLLSKKL